MKKSIYLSILSTIIMIVLYTLTDLGYMGPNPVGQTANYNEPLIVPAGYAFAIWGLIYLGIIIFPLYQLFTNKDRNPLWKNVHAWFSLNVIGNGLWLVLASYDWLWLSVIVIIVMLISLYNINILIAKIKGTKERPHYWFEEFVFHIYFAWITLATALNISAALQFYDWNGFGVSENIWAIVILIVAAGIAALVFLKFKINAYAFVVIWAFMALIIRHSESNMVLTVLSGCIVILFFSLFFIERKTPSLVIS